MTILDEIVEVKKKEVKELTVFRNIKIESSRVTKFSEALKGRDKISLIAEVKQASPSEGIIRKDFDPVALARAYEASGASAISVLTDCEFFKGDLEHLRQVAAVTTLPILRKDFIIDELQVMQSKLAGASAILLIASILDESELKRLRELAEGVGMEALVEVHNEDELKAALSSGAEIIGINNRDLKTFTVDLQTTIDLLEKIPDDVIVVSESGIKSHGDMKRLQGSCDAVLVGTSLLRFPDVSLRVHELFMNRPLVKVCGIQDLETAQFCEEQGVEFLGFNFVKDSSRFIDPNDARVIANSLTKAKTVGLFVNEPAAYVNAVARDLDLDYIQLHGDEDEAYCAHMVRPVIKSFLPSEKSFDGVTPLFDLKKGTEGVIDLKDEPKSPYFLAGGLNASNVASVIEGHQPFVVDVARGVETEGKKDTQLISEFLTQLEAC
jgi:indole-3-glycerol phosphate synthase/phosphoribosylanthranilate isomerase/anthranilate synthase/indole-3-glycerol phosphate synthase/phosphoribosylanthranilate isomerase